MKYTLLLFFLLYAFNTVSQGITQNNDYQKAKALIAEIDSIVTPNGIQESFFAPIGGVKQWINVRGKDKNNPIILFVHGGPASPLSSVSWLYQKQLEEYFTIVNYDQRGAGRTYHANDTALVAGTLYIDQYVNDLIEITKLLTSRYQKKKVVIAGHSWGTIISMKAVLNQPDLFYAYIGIGQVINTMDNEKLSYDYGLKMATSHRNDTALAELRSIYPYPGEAPLTRDRIIIARKWPQHYGGLTAYRQTSGYYFRAPLLYPGYTTEDVKAINEGSLFTLDRVIDEFLKVDFFPIKSFPVPVLMFCGRHDYTTPNEPTLKWMKQVKAPYKKVIWFEHSAHLPHVEEPGKLFLTFINEIKPLIR